MNDDATRTELPTGTLDAAAADANGERTIPLPPGPLRLDVRNPHGAVEIVGRVRPDVLVAWTKVGDPASTAWQRANLRIDVVGDAITAAPDFGPHLAGAGLGDASSVVSAVLGAIGLAVGSWTDGVRFDLRVEVPASLPDAIVAARTASGRVHLSGISASTITAHAASGTIAVEGCGGEIELNGASGRIAITRCSGGASVTTASGAIEVLATRPLEISANTASGAIRLRLSEGAAGEARCNTASGAVVVEAVPSLGVAVSVRSVSGRVAAEPPFAAQGRREWRSGDGQAYRVKARTASGAIRLRRTEEGHADEPTSAGTTPLPAIPAPDVTPPTVARPPTVPEAASEAAPPSPSPTAPRPTADEILRSVERGELGVDEALRLLDDRDGGSELAP